MSIYFPEADVAIEVIPQPDGLPEADCGTDAVRIYVREDQVDSDALVEALAELVRGRERKLGRSRSGVGSEAAARRASEFLAGAGEPEGQPSGNEEKRSRPQAGDAEGAREQLDGKAARETPGRDAQELMEDLLDAQDELAEALSELTGQMLVSPGCDPDSLAGEGEGDGYDVLDELLGYDLWLQDRLDDLCCAHISSMRRPGREISIGSCKNLYIGV